MSKKRPFFKPTTAWFFKCENIGNSKDVGGICGEKMEQSDIRVRITDARELTPEKAVEKVLHLSYAQGAITKHDAEWLADEVGMIATTNCGKVRVRKIKEAKR